MNKPWTEHYTYLPVKDLDGNMIHGPTPVMLRQNSENTWEYREMTPEEKREYLSSTAW